MIIAVDFDGTLVEHEYPHIGQTTPHSDRVIKKLVDKGHQIILYTMRSGKELEDAVKYCVDHGISLYGINSNPTQHKWTTSPKVYAQIYIDDAALGCPLIYKPGVRPYVDWLQVEQILEELV